MAILTVLAWNKHKSIFEQNGFVEKNVVDPITWNRDLYPTDRLYVKKEAISKDIELVDNLMEWDCEIEFFIDGEIDEQSGSFGHAIYENR